MLLDKNIRVGSRAAKPKQWAAHEVRGASGRKGATQVSKVVPRTVSGTTTATASASCRTFHDGEDFPKANTTYSDMRQRGRLAACPMAPQELADTYPVQIEKICRDSPTDPAPRKLHALVPVVLEIATNAMNHTVK